MLCAGAGSVLSTEKLIVLRTERSRESALAFVVRFLCLLLIPVRSLRAAGKSARLASHFPRVGQNIPRLRTTFGYKAFALPK